MRNSLKPIRAERGWSQEVLGKHLGVSRQTINAIETGRYDPSLPLAFKIARLFKRSIEDIFHDGDDYRTFDVKKDKESQDLPAVFSGDTPQSVQHNRSSP